MPVLIVSEKTWPHDGFSRKRSILPSSSVTTIPNSSGFSTDLSPIVTAACFSRWNSSNAPRSMSQSASPRAGSAERRLLDRVLDREAERLAVAEVAPDRLRHECKRHDHVVESVP